MNTKALTTNQLQRVEDWINENVTVNEYGWATFKKYDRHTKYTKYRKGIGHTHHYTVSDDVKVPFKAPTLAAYLAHIRPDLKVVCQDWSATYGRQGRNGVYYSQSSRRGYRIQVFDTNQPNPGHQYGNHTPYLRVLDHDTTETYRNNNEIVAFVAKAKAGTELAS